MKTRIHQKLSIGMVSLLGALTTGCVEQAASSPETEATLINPVPDSEAVAQVSAEDDSDWPDSTAGISDAPARPISGDNPLPPNLRPTGAVAELIKLADSGVHESVMLAFVKNSLSMFNITSDEIIYLNDIGVPAPVITAMIERDQHLKDGSAAPATFATSSSYYPPNSSQPETTQISYTSENDYPPTTPQPVEGVDPNFYEPLAPYGNWLQVDGQGACWQPTAAATNPDWQPYFDSGRWVYTDCGWYWMSDYSWGWAPFHYGRWFRHARLGWCWTPDNVWGPAWVCWRYTDDYCGWAPLPPAVGFDVAAGLRFHGRHVGPFSDFHLSAACFPFVHIRNLCDHNPRRHAVPPGQVASIFHKSVSFAGIVPRNHAVFNHGVALERVSAAAHMQIRSVAIHEARTDSFRRGPERLENQGTSLSVFRLPASRQNGIHSTLTAQTRPEVHNANSVIGQGRSLSPAITSSQPASQTTATRANSSGSFVIRGDHWTTGSSSVPVPVNSPAQSPYLDPQHNFPHFVQGQATTSPLRPQAASQSGWLARSRTDSDLADRMLAARSHQPSKTAAELYSQFNTTPVTSTPQQPASPSHHGGFGFPDRNSAFGFQQARSAPAAIESAGSQHQFAPAAHHSSAPAVTASPQSVPAPEARQPQAHSAPAPEPPQTHAPTFSAPAAPATHESSHSSFSKPGR